MTTPPEGLRVIDVNDVCAMAELDRCVLVVWRLQPTTEMFGKRNENLVALAAKYPGQCALLEVIEAASKPPSDENRKFAVEAFRKLGKDLAAVCFVLDGAQLRVAFVRTILTGITFLIPQMQPSKVFKRISDAADWVKPRIGVAADDAAFTSRVLAAFEYLRAAKS